MRRLPVLLLATALLTGCSSAADRSSSDSAAGAAAPPEAQPVKAQPDTTVTRQVVRTASLSVDVADVAVAADRATAIALRPGGLVQSDSRDRDRASLVLRVPTGDVPATLTALAALGEETGREASENDVTEQSVDLASRLATQRASVARVRALLADADTLSEVTTLEGELTRREADLESLANRSRALASQVELATVDVLLVRADVAPATRRTGFGSGLAAGVDALSASARVLAVVVGGALPFVPLLLLALAGRVAWRRRARPAA